MIYVVNTKNGSVRELSTRAAAAEMIGVEQRKDGVNIFDDFLVIEGDKLEVVSSIVLRDKPSHTFTPVAG